MATFSYSNPIHASRHATDGADPITPDMIGAAPGTVGQITTAGGLDEAGPGVYWTWGDAIAALPWIPSAAAFIHVMEANSNRWQTCTSTDGRATWQRTHIGGSWTDWTPVAVDTTWRSLSLANGWTGTLKARLSDGWVSVRGIGLDGTQATENALAYLPVPFQQGPSLATHGGGNRSGLFTAGDGTVVAAGGSRGSTVRADGTTTWTDGSFSLSYPVDAELSSFTTLPGTPA